MSVKQANIERFNNLAAQWDDDPIRVQTGQKVARAMHAALSPDGTESVLEFGAGTGILTLLMASKVAKLTVLDSSASMLEVLKAKCQRKGLSNVEVIEGSVPDDLPATTFDIIYSSMTLHHVENVAPLLHVLFTHLKPGGHVALADLDAEDGSFHGDSAGVAHHGFARDTFAGWLRQAGFADVTLSTAWTMQRPDEDGANHAYPLFLAVACKPGD